MSWNGFGRRGLGSRWLGKGLVKAPRRRDFKARLFGRCEALEPRQMLSADGFVFGQTTDFVAISPAETGGGPGAPIGAMVPLSETFQLSSNPTANHTIYLDFDGHITEDPYWDAALIGEGNLPPGRFGLPFLTPAFTLDGDGTTFSQAELTMIQEAYFRVAEDFAPFDVNVTTVEPPLGDLMFTDPSDTRWGVRIAIGGSTFDWYSRTAPNTPRGAAGGVALLGSFSSDLDTPAYAFTADGTPSGKTIGLTISHEAGHTLGLAHDGNFIDPVNIPVPNPDEPPTEPEVREYYPGHDEGAGIWGPIMGAPFTPEITQWSKGEYYLANNEEDDLEIITTGNGFGYRVDDFANTLAAASTLTPNYDAGGFVANGLIEQNTDLDWFMFEVEAGDVSIQANPAAIGGNLDIKLEVFDSDGTPLGTGGSLAPDFDQSASYSFTSLIPGRYFVSVQGDAFAANPQEALLQTQGYTDYGSLGQYTLSIAAELGAQPDAFEGPNGNNNNVTPFDLQTGDHFLPNLSIHRDGDEDWFLWQAPEDGQLAVDLLFQHATGDLDLKVYTETGIQLGFGGSSNDNESVTIDVNRGERYLIRAYGFGGSMQESYSLRVDGPGLASDEFEFNNTIAFASNLGSTDQNRQLSLSYDGDVDWFEWLAPVGGTLSIETLFDRDDLELTIEVYEDDGTLVATSANTATGDRLETAVSVAADPAPGEEADNGLYRIRVFSEANDPAKRVGLYQLILNGTELSPSANEPNNTPSTATQITRERARFPRESIHTPSDKDFYSYTPTENGVLEVRLFHLYEFGDLDMGLSTASGQLIELATSRNDDEGISARVVAGVQYFIEVYGHQGDTHAAYTLETVFTPTPPVIGDYNNDGVVTLRDQTAWREDYGMVGVDLPADGNDDGIVNAADYTIWKDSLGSGFGIDGLGASLHDHDHYHAALPDATPNAELSVVDPTPSLARVPYSAPQRVDSWIASEAGSVDTKPLEAAGIASPLAFATTTVDAYASNESPSDTSSLVDDNDVRSRALLLALTRFEAAGDDESVETSRSGEEDHNDSLAELDAAFGLSI